MRAIVKLKQEPTTSYKQPKVKVVPMSDEEAIKIAFSIPPAKTNMSKETTLEFLINNFGSKDEVIKYFNKSIKNEAISFENPLKAYEKMNERERKVYLISLARFLGKKIRKMKKYKEEILGIIEKYITELENIEEEERSRMMKKEELLLFYNTLKEEIEKGGILKRIYKKVAKVFYKSLPVVFGGAMLAGIYNRIAGVFGLTGLMIYLIVKGSQPTSSYDPWSPTNGEKVKVTFV